MLLIHFYTRLIFIIFLGAILALPQRILAGSFDVRERLPDSLELRIKNCQSDTCRFKILSDFFWTYANQDVRKVIDIGNRAFKEIADSKNLKARADGYDIKGFILESTKEYDSASVYFRKALGISTRINYPVRSAWSYYHLANIHAIKGNVDSAFYFIRKRLNLYAKANNQKMICEALKQFALTYCDYTTNKDSAAKYLNEWLTLSRKIEDTNLEMNALLVTMYFYNKNNNIGRFLGTINEALALAEKTNDQKAIIKIYYNLGELFLDQKKNYDIAMTYYKKVLEICQSKNREWESTILNDIGALYLMQGNDSMALVYVKKGLQVARDLGYKHQMSEAYRNLGNIYKFNRNFNAAIENFGLCYETGCDKCEKIAFHNALIDLGDAYINMNDRNKALAYYKKSLELAMQYKAEKELALSNLCLGNFYLKDNRSLSEQYYRAAIKNADNAGDIHVIRIVADTLSNFFQHLHNYPEAFRYQGIARDMADSINRVAQQVSLAEWELRFVFEKMNKEREANAIQSKEEIKRQKIYRNSAIIFSFLVFILGLVIFLSYRRKKKDHILLEKVSSELHKADENKLRFFANISHEFRTPLTLILNPAKDLLLKESNSREYKKQIEYIYNNALKLSELTNQIMDLQKLDAGKLTINKETTNIVEFSLGIISSFESLCQKKQNRIHVRSNYRSASAKIDRDKFGKIITNLLSNAFKFCYEKSTIQCRILITNDSFDFQIQDEGIGIQKEEIDNVFKQYYQSSNGQVVEGTGIGLAYVKELTEFMHGTVNLESFPDKGTTVSVSIPINEPEIHGTEILDTTIPVNNRLATKSIVIQENVVDERQTILIVEDNDELRAFIADLLKDDYNLLLAADGTIGFEAALNYMPDLIISDVMMPKMNGFRMCENLKKDSHTSHIPVVLLTAKDSAQSNKDGYLSGADDYIIKPFDNDLLKLKIRNNLATTEAARKHFDFKLLGAANGFKFGDTDKEFLKKCLSIIEKNIDDSNFSVEMLASEMSFSNRNFYRKIRMLTDFTPAEMVRVYRLQYANKLLLNTNMRIFEIALAVGYEDVNRFRQAYKKLFGYPPSESHNKIPL